MDFFHLVKVKIKVKWSRYRPGVAQRVGTGIALLFHDRGTGRWWVVSSTPRPHFTTPGKDPITISQEAGCAPGPVWTDGKNLVPHRDSIPDRPTRSSFSKSTELSCPIIHSVVCLKACSKPLLIDALWCYFYKITFHWRTSSSIRKMSAVRRCIKFTFTERIKTELKQILQL